MNNQTKTRRKEYRLQLMATVSAVVLLGGSAEAAAKDADRPPLWIELGWQYERVGGEPEKFDPAFFSSIVAGGFTSPLKFENALPWAYGANGTVSYQPENSDWVFSAAIRFGRSHGRKSLHEQTFSGPFKQYIGTHFLGTVTPFRNSFTQTKASNTETHAILDFRAGKDVGLGMFGSGSTSTFSAGIRYAQLKLGSHSEIDARPDYYRFHDAKYGLRNEHDYSGTNDAARSFRGLGPEISWNASARLAGNPQDSEIALDWGVNAGLLFGRQKTKVHHRTSAYYYCFALKYTQCPVGPGITRGGNAAFSHSTQTADTRRAHSVIVPNLGGYAGLSFNWTNAKISLGYRADVFFNAFDGGIDERKSVNRSFYGPFASISVGLGD